MKKKLPAVRRDGAVHLLFDCKPLCHAALYATGSLSYRGKPTGVVYSFLRQVFDIAHRFKTNKLFFLWDAGKSYRHDIYPLYKAKREKRWEDMDADEWEETKILTAQIIALHHKILPRMGFRNTFCFHNYEADDLIAVLVNKLADEDKRTIIVSNDNDMYQLLDRADMFMTMRDEVFNQRHFKNKYGIKPSQWVLAKSIGGCNGDDVPGIQGISDPKSTTSKALKYVRGELTHGKIYDRIVSDTGKQIIEKTRQLVELPCRPDLMPEIKIRRDRVTKKRVIRMLDKHRFISMLEQKYFYKLEEIFWS